MKPAPGHTRASVGQTMRAVAWSFFGVRRRSDLERDAHQLRPVHLILGGLMGAVVFVIFLVLLIRWIVSSGVAG
ncbi:MAG TPA: DUF2970 domain-containing protein [Rubrivivax sp.]|nr:DUF2970 domain-containing protein [Rubrivivax sp.]